MTQANDPIRLAEVESHRVSCGPWILAVVNEKPSLLTSVLEHMLSGCWHWMVVSVEHLGAEFAEGRKSLEAGLAI